MKLFPKLALTISGLLGFTILSLCLSFYWIQARRIRVNAEQQRQAVLENLVHMAQESFLTDDDLLLIKYTGLLAKWNPGLFSASVANPQGEVLAHSEPSQIGKPSAEMNVSADQVSILSQPVHIGAHWVGTASVAFSEHYYQDQIRAQLLAMRTRMIQVGALSLVVGLVISFLLALSWSRPIRRLAQTSEEIGKGHWDAGATILQNRRDEIGALSRAFNDMSQQLKELERMKEDFVSAVTHELRSPLGAIESYLNLIREEMREGAPVTGWDSYLERIRVNTQRLTRFVNDLLDVAALERGKITLEKRPTDILALTKDVASLFELKFKEKNLQCRMTAPDHLPRALVDSEKIRQVLINLVTNAFKFTTANGHIEIILQSLPSKNQLQIGVKDDGIGIAKSDQGKIFNKFEQVKSARLTVKGPKGTGLGLSISRTLIDLHGGTLWVESEPGKGSLFAFTVPIATADASAVKEPVA